MSTNAGSGGNRWFRTAHAESTIDSHDESMEMTKDLQKECSGITVTLNQSAADYTVMLARESRQKRGVLRTNNQMLVANRAGDVLGSNATRTVNNATKDACNLIRSDWAQHGRIAAPAESPAVPPTQAEKLGAQPAAVPAAVVTSAPGTQESPQEEQARADRNTVVVSAQPASSVQAESLEDAARRAEQHQACFKLAFRQSKHNLQISIGSFFTTCRQIAKLRFPRREP